RSVKAASRDAEQPRNSRSVPSAGGAVLRASLRSCLAPVALISAFFAAENFGVAGPGDQPSNVRQTTFSRDVAPILQRSCQNCHRPGNIAPMSFLTYKDVRPWARAIKEKVVLREMPPWFIDRNVGIRHFKDNPSLSDEEIAKITAWV